MWRTRRRFHGPSPIFNRQRSLWWLGMMLLMTLCFVLIYIFEQKLEPVLRTYAVTELKKIAQNAVTKGVKDVAKNHDVHRLMKIEKDKQGRVTMIAIHSQTQAQMYSQVTERIQESLNKLSDREIKLSLGHLLQSNLFTKYGPKINVEIWPKGAGKISLIPRLQSAGINTVMVSLTLHVRMEMGLMVPFSEESTIVDIDYPLGEMFMVGEVPEFYYYMDQGKVKQGSTQVPAPPAPSILPNKLDK